MPSYKPCPPRYSAGKCHGGSIRADSTEVMLVSTLDNAGG